MAYRALGKPKPERLQEEMELILRGLDIQVRASNQEIQIEGIVPVSVEEAGHLVTIAQTSGCLLSKSVALGSQRLECIPFERELI